MKKYDVAIVGAGPAGLSAAVQCAKLGLNVVVVDESPWAGGQLVKQTHKFFGSERHSHGMRGFQIARELAAEACSLGANLLLNSVVWGIFEYHQLGVADLRNGRSHRVEATSIVLATGAAEKVILFPGWTLPGVMGAGAAQTLMNIHRVTPGTRVLMVGAGNVGLIVAYQLLQAGVEVCAVVEAKPEVSGYQVHADAIRRLGVPILTSHTIAAAHGHAGVEVASVSGVDEAFRCIPGTEKSYDVDAICLAVGLRPLDELPRMANCEFAWEPALGGHVPVHTENLETSRAGIYVAGDAAGIEEATIAMEEGRLAALSIAWSIGRLKTGEFAALKEDLLEYLAVLRSRPSGPPLQAAKTRIHKALSGV